MKSHNVREQNRQIKAAMQNSSKFCNFTAQIANAVYTASGKHTKYFGSLSFYLITSQKRFEHSYPPS